MENFNALVEAAKQLIEQNVKYAAKPTKAESKRIRSTVLKIQKLAVEAKRDLLVADKTLGKDQ
jgi:hypothetical protein